MNLKRFLSEPVILAFVAFVDLVSISALVICHGDVTKKETQAVVEQQVHDAVSAKTNSASSERVHYSAESVNSLLHPVPNDKFRIIARPDTPSLKNQ